LAAWVFQGNPDRFDIDDYVARYPELIYWRTPRHAKEITVGDRAFLWRSGPKAGAIAIGTVVEAPTRLSAVRHPEALATISGVPRNPIQTSRRLGFISTMSACLQRRGAFPGVRSRTIPISEGHRSSPCRTVRCFLWITEKRAHLKGFGGGPPGVRVWQRPHPLPKGCRRCTLISDVSDAVPYGRGNWLKFALSTGDASVPSVASMRSGDTRHCMARGYSRFITSHHLRRRRHPYVRRLPTSPFCAPTVTGPCTPRRPWRRITPCSQGTCGATTYPSTVMTPYPDRGWGREGRLPLQALPALRWTPRSRTSPSSTAAGEAVCIVTSGEGRRMPHRSSGLDESAGLRR